MTVGDGGASDFVKCNLSVNSNLLNASLYSLSKASESINILKYYCFA